MDVLGSLTLTMSGNKYLLVVIDCFIKWVKVFPLKVPWKSQFLSPCPKREETSAQGSREESRGSAVFFSQTKAEIRRPLSKCVYKVICFRDV